MFRNLNKFIILSLVVAAWAASSPALAATLYLRPSQASVSAGNIVNVEVLVNTDNKWINNAESIIQYPSDLLEVISIDKTSIFSLWVQEPNYSNGIGQVSFNGGVPNPGYKGAAGKVASIVFKAKKAGTASVVFSDSAVRENDGLGTNILTSKSGAEISITATPVAPPAPVPVPAPAPVPAAKVDTDKPKDLSVETEVSASGKVTLSMKATDASGLDYFQIIPDTEESFSVDADKKGEATAQVQFSSGGEHTIRVRAYDKASNFAETKVSVEVAIGEGEELRIDSYPAKIRVNESVEISGTAPYTEALIRVSLKDQKGVVSVYKVKSNSTSRFYVSSQPVVEEGELILWAEVVEADGTVIATSDKLTVLVETPLLFRLGTYTISLMKVLIPATGLLIAFLFIVLYGWLKFFTLYHQIKKEGSEAEKIVDKSFELLKKDLQDHLLKLANAKSRRKLTAEEKSFLTNFGKDLGEAEQVIKKELKDISRKRASRLKSKDSPII